MGLVAREEERSSPGTPLTRRGEKLSSLSLSRSLLGTLQLLSADAHCRFSSRPGGVILSIKWLEGVFYAAINACTAKNVFHSHVLQILNKLFLSAHLGSCETDKSSCPKFQLTDFLNKNYINSLFHRRYDVKHLAIGICRTVLS